MTDDRHLSDQPLAGTPEPLASAADSASRDLAELETLLNALADDQLDEVGQRRLNDMLRADASLRQQYLAWMQLHADLHWDYAAAASADDESREERIGSHGSDSKASLPLSTPAEAGRTGVSRPRLSPRNSNPVTTKNERLLRGVLVGVAVLLLAIGISSRSTPVRREAKDIVTLAAASGAVTWSHPGEETRAGLTAGAELPAGTLVVEGEAASAQLRFADGTRLTLSGDAELSFTDGKQKQLVLRRGLLAAQVERQPPIRPLVVRTPTAEVRVVGTVFSVSADQDGTELMVESGRVRMRRLADGKEVELTDRQSAVATFDTAEPMKPARPAPPPPQWTQDFREPPPPNCKGHWQPARDGQAAMVTAVPCIAGRDADDRPVIHYGITARAAPTAASHGLVTLTPTSRLRVRYRVASDSNVRIMLGLQKPNGGFGGNFQVWLAADEVSRLLTTEPSTSDASWQSLDIPIAEFEPLIDHIPRPPNNAQVSLVFVATTSIEAGLEVAELSITP
ncbi:MAG: FecR domain-containing protein [Planctomycetales bacterium]|nr:FecR domain-containing protein [Planctomycetales bacterium]